MELKGNKGLFDTGKSSRTWGVPTLSLRLDVLPEFRGCFGRKMGVFGPNLRRFGAPPHLAPSPWAATGELGAQTLDLGRPCVNAEDGQSRVEPEALGRSNGKNVKEKCCCWLLLLLVAC